ncbi:unnamed protein product [Paramecium octaurelia]|uniref:Transmembrane protein n=1 Tax=Paramecium octaurelia TaxID=43137 RepID=A0A8S1WYC6_PAROT|nr:unnamed protein product [Paramecium octaurelia]
MIFFILILQVQSCFKTYEEINLYPTNGEYLEYPMNNLFQGDNYSYYYEPKIPNIEIVNAFNEILNIQGYEFISISFNETHFATITKDSHVILYEWKNFNIQQYGQVAKIDKIYQCYNIIFFGGIDILLDCYTEYNLYLLQLMNTSFNIVYSIQTNKPISSKMQGILNESKTLLIYAQYYQNLSIITLFSSQYQNLTSYEDQFIQFGIPQRENPSIYLLYRQSISQFIIIQNYTFVQTINYSFQRTVNNFQVYYDYQAYSQCDLLQIVYKQDQHNYFAYQILGCQDVFYQNYEANYFSKKSMQLFQFFFDNEFVIFQSQDYLTLYQQQYNEISIASIAINENTQIYYNPYNNQLFTFNKLIIVYELIMPSLQINLTEQYDQGKTYDITIYAQFLNLTFNGICKMFMSITILDQNDTNIYVIYNQNFPQYRYINGAEQSESVFSGYSGKLLSYIVNSDNKQFGFFMETTLQTFFELQNQLFYMAQLLNPTQGVGIQKIYFIGVTNQSVQVFYSNFLLNSFYPFFNINITIEAQSLQVAYDIDQTIIIGLSDNDTIYLYKIYDSAKLPYFSSSEYKFEQQFSQFLVTFNNLITLFINKEISIMTLNFTDLVIINQTIINNLYNTNSLIKFNPIQIAVNPQSLSSCLFINNINNVIIIAIGKNNIPIPISIIECKFQIKYINIVDQQLVLSYICNQGFELCFQVWNIQKFRDPFFMKNMMSVKDKNLVQILSDNLFFYVQFSNYSVFVYNPQLPEHMSLYYQLNLSSQLTCATKGILYYSNTINQLSTRQSFKLYVNQSLNFEHSYPIMIYNFNITTQFNQTAIQFTPNQSLIYLSNFTYFQPKTNKTILLSIQDLNLIDRTFTIPMNIILDRQANRCYFSDSSDNSYVEDVDQFDEEQYSNNLCNLTNFGYFTTIPNQNYTLITAVNNQFFVLQNNNEIKIVNLKLEILQSYDYSNLNFTECLKSTSFNLTISSICQNETAQYWLSISLDSFGNVLDVNSFLIPHKFIEISKINNIAQFNFILGSYNSKYQYVYFFTSLNNSMQKLGFNGDCQDFSVAQLNSSLELNQSNLIVILYIINNVPYSQYLQFSENSITLKKNDFHRFIISPKPVLYVQILILQIINNQIFIFISSTDGFGQFLILQLFQPFFDGIRKVIATTPSSNGLALIPNSIYSNGLLLQQFKQGSTYIIGVYQTTKLLNNNFEEPILMLGQLNTTSLGFALITNQEGENATCLALNNGSVLYYPIYTRMLKCHYKEKRNTFQVMTSCKNDFSSGSYKITFILPDLDTPSRRWIYSLIAIIIFQIIGFYILVKYRMRNIGYINTEIEL